MLQAVGYRARVTSASGDGGFDIVAHRDPLGVEAPIIKVQCKRTTASQGGPQVQQLTGTLSWSRRTIFRRRHHVASHEGAERRR